MNNAKQIKLKLKVNKFKKDDKALMFNKNSIDYNFKPALPGKLLDSLYIAEGEDALSSIYLMVMLRNKLKSKRRHSQQIYTQNDKEML